NQRSRTEALKPAMFARLPVIIITVEDKSIEIIADTLVKSGIGATIGHVSGSLPSSLIKKEGRFSIHPAMSLASKEAYKNLEKAIFSIEGDERGIKVARDLVETLGVRYVEIDTENKALYHAACVIASNYLVAIELMAKTILNNIGFDEKIAENLVLSLAEGTLLNMKRLGIKRALTGPISRGDWDTVRKHMDELSRKNEVILKAYVALADYLKSIVDE
ncbi:MAG: Rossmann-like and DUF2520 domain-containing protein, partial [Thermosulfidibacteraceae bacterium]